MAVPFLAYDIIFLILFTLFVVIFLYSHRKKLQREGVMYLYRTSFGLRIIDQLAKKYKRALRVLSYCSVVMGYLLMGVMVYLTMRIVYFYYQYPALVKIIKVPPVMPLIPYLPQLFNIDFLPPFYFTYWIVIIAIIAIFHEMAHGIYARYYNIRVKSTGFGFLGPFLAAFVEPDEKQMAKKKIFPQLTILSAGTFANILTMIVFFILLVLYFSVAFVPSGIVLNTYAYTAIPIENIASVGNITLNHPSYAQLLDGLQSELQTKSLAEVKASDGLLYLIDVKLLENQQEAREFFVAYYDAPAIRAGMEGAILSFNGEQVTNREEFQGVLLRYHPRDSVVIVTKNATQKITQTIILTKHPLNATAPFLGIGFTRTQEARGILSRIVNFFTFFKSPDTYYEPRVDGLSLFFYNLLWWIVLISLSVALVNMLPLGIFDGGRFFYLTVLALTKSEKIAQKSFRWITLFFLALLLLVMFFWAVAFFVR